GDPRRRPGRPGRRCARSRGPRARADDFRGSARAACGDVPPLRALGHGARHEGLTVWDSDAAYDNFMGRFSSRLATVFAAWAGVAEMARVANGRVAVCMWDLEGHELLASVMHVRARLGEADAEPRRYRTLAEVEELVGPGAESAALDVEAPYEDFEDYWSSLL